MFDEVRTEEAISISPEAANAVKAVMEEKSLDNHALRIYVAGSGCSGVQFGLAIDDQALEGDTNVEMEGVRLVVDPQSMDYLKGGSIDYVNDPQKGTGFVINAPQAQTGGCGCESNDTANSCGSGGGCGCS